MKGVSSNHAALKKLPLLIFEKSVSLSSTLLLMEQQFSGPLGLAC